MIMIEFLAEFKNFFFENFETLMLPISGLIGTIFYCVSKESQWFNMLVEAIGESCQKALEEREKNK